MRCLIFLVILFGCTDRQSKNNTSVEPNSIVGHNVENQTTISPNEIRYGETDTHFYTFAKDIEDTLSYYRDKPQFHINHLSGVFEIKAYSVGEKKFAVVQLLGARLLVYEQVNNEWVNIFYADTEMGYQNEIKIIDINFDSHNDVLLTDIQGAHGNRWSTVFLYDTLNNTLKKVTYLDLPNLEIDRKNKLLRTHWYGSYCTRRLKELYRFNNDSIELVKAVGFESSCYTNSDSSILRFMECKDGEYFTIDSIVDSEDNNWDKYLHSLWDSRKGYN